MFRRKLWWCILTAGVTSVCLAQQQSSSSIPFTLQDNLIRVPVVLDGQQVEAVLDSGTGSLGLDYAYAISLGLKPGASNGTVPGGGAPEPMFPVTVKHLEFGPEQLSDISGVALDLRHLSSSSGFSVQVLLGQPVIKDRALRIDYPNRRITFLSPGAEAVCADPIPVSFYGGAPVVAVTLRATPESQPRTLHLVLDLGTRHYAAMLGGSFLSTADGQAMERAGKAQQVGTGTGGAFDGYSVQVASLTVGKHHFNKLAVALTSHVGGFQAGVIDGSLGVPLWEDGTVTLDYAHERVCLDLPLGPG
jgi:hypothetical protein